MKIRCIDRRDPQSPKETEHEVLLTTELPWSFFFKSHDLPPPALGRKYFVSERELSVAELQMDLKAGGATFYLVAEYLDYRTGPKQKIAEPKSSS